MNVAKSILPCFFCFPRRLFVCKCLLLFGVRLAALPSPLAQIWIGRGALRIKQLLRLKRWQSDNYQFFWQAPIPLLYYGIPQLLQFWPERRRQCRTTGARLIWQSLSTKQCWANSKQLEYETVFSPWARMIIKQSSSIPEFSRVARGEILHFV